jgi:hypothetical protein
MDLVPEHDHVTVVTRWLRANRDVEHYTLDLHQPIELGGRKMDLLASDLSMRTKENLFIPRDDRFLVPANERRTGVFSQRFPEQVSLTGLEIDSTGLSDYAARWKGSRDGGKTWDTAWHSDPRELGRVNATLLRVDLQAGDQAAAVRDMVVGWTA